MSPPILFCPRCAEPMGRIGNEITCEPGRMGLAPAMEEVLLDRFGADVRADAPPPSSASFYCPACRVGLDDEMHCPKCAGTLFDLHVQLVELHPHFPYY